MSGRVFPIAGMTGLTVVHSGVRRRAGVVIEDNGDQCVLVRWTDGSMGQGGGTDGWYSRYTLVVQEK